MPTPASSTKTVPNSHSGPYQQCQESGDGPIQDGGHWDWEWITRCSSTIHVPHHIADIASAGGVLNLRTKVVADLHVEPAEPTGGLTAPSALAALSLSSSLK